MGVSQAGGHGGSQATWESVGLTPPSVSVRGRGSRPMSGPRLVGSSPASRGFRALPLSSRYASMLLFVLIVEFLSVTNLCFV